MRFIYGHCKNANNAEKHKKENKSNYKSQHLEA